MKPQDMVEVQSKFISPRHIGHSANIHLERLNLQEDAQYRLQNVTKMQVVDLQLALRIYDLSSVQEEINLEIFTLDKADKLALEQAEKEIQKNSSYKVSTQTSNNAKEVLDLSVIMINLVSLLSDESKGDGDIKEILKQIENNLNFYKKEDNTIFSDIKDCNFSNTQEAFVKAKKALDEICQSLDKYASEAKKDFENRFNKDIINLSARIMGATHTPLLAQVLIHKVGMKLTGKILVAMLEISGPFDVMLSILWLLRDIYDFFSSQHKNNQKIEAAYKVYGAILSIYERLDYPLASLLNFGHIGASNLITTQKDNLFTYSLYPNDAKFNSTFLYPFLKNNVANFEDISYKVTLSLDNQKEPNQAYIENIFEKNNKDSTYINAKKNTQFSIFGFEHLYKIYEKDKENNLLHSSAFQHLQNMFLRFDSFLFVKSSSFSSALANDMLLQSFTPSKQQNKPRMNKAALFLTNCLHNGLPEYQTQQHIKDKIFDNGNTKKNVLFLSAMFRVKKAIFVRTLIDNLTDLFKNLENYAYRNQTQQTLYLKQNLGKLIKEYDAGEVKYQGHYILSYSLNDKKLCAMDERDFCNFVYDLCQIFITKKHAKMLDEYMNNSLLRLYRYGNDQQALSKAKADIQKIFQEMIAIVLDVSQLFSHFNAYEVARFKDYQKELEVEYNKQREILEKFFKTESFTSEKDKQTTPNNVFYQAKEIKKLCIALLDKYFNKKINTNEEDLESLLQNAQDKIKKEQSQAEEELQTSNQNAYYQITIEYVIPLLPLNQSFLNCLEERERFLFCRLIICEMNATSKPHQSARSVIDDLLACYEFIIRFCALSNLNDKEFESLLLCDAKEEAFNTICEISIDSGQKILKNELKDRLKKIDKYGIVSAMIFNDTIKGTIKNITSNIAKELDKKHFNLHSGNLPKGLSGLPVIANSTISYVCNTILDKIFPVQIGSVKDMKQQAIALTFALNRHTNTPYATCKQGSEYLTFPIEITQTLINADLQALIIGGSALNSGLFVHTPSIALFNQDSQNSLKSLKETLRHFMNNKVNLIGIGEKGKSIVKEAYAKLWFYLDMGENQEIESYLREELKTKPNDYTLENLTSDKTIKVKLKKAKELDNSDENFMEVKGNAKGGIRFNHDFLIQLKRVAEYNYGMYRGLISVEENSQNDDETTYDDGAEKADKSPDKYLCGNLIYNEDYIPTMIDIVD